MAVIYRVFRTADDRLTTENLAGSKAFAASLLATKHFANGCIGNDPPVGEPKTNWANLSYFLTMKC